MIGLAGLAARLAAAGKLFCGGLFLPVACAISSPV
jgi:hypothetical protein